MGSRDLNHRGLIAIDPHRGRSISLRPEPIQVYESCVSDLDWFWSITFRWIQLELGLLKHPGRRMKLSSA